MNKNRNSGVALIMVLGLLTVMVLMAVTFAITMRTERLAAGNYADNVRARELVQVGLARAMADDVQNPDRIVVGRDANPKITVMGGGIWELNDLAVFETPGTFPTPISINQPYQISYSEGKDVRLNVALTTEGTFPDTIMPSEDFSIEAGSLKVSGIRLYYRGTPVYLTGDVNTYYVIPIDQTHIKLANSYENALCGTALIAGGPGTLNLKPIHYIIPIHTIVSKSPAPINTIVLNKTCKFKTGDPVTYYSPPAPYTTDGKFYYVRVVEEKTIQLADSYNKAILGDCLNVAAFDQNGYLKKHGFLVPPWLGRASYTTNAIRSIGEISELVTFDALSQVIIKNRYSSGDCIAFTTTNTLPSPLEEKTPYYVIGVSVDRIKLATSIDNALASPPVPITLSGGSGNHRMYLTLLSGEVTNYIPMSLYAGVSTAACAAVTNTYVDITTAINTTANILLGKYRYLVANCSGLLDANLIGSSTKERRFGSSAEEISIENLPEIETSRKTAFLNNRNTYIRYETIRQLAALDARPTNLFVYSHFPSEKWNTDMLNYFAPVNLGGSVPDLINRMSAITNAFGMAGITEEEHRNCMFRSLIDYVDSDKVPNNYGGTLPLPIPLPAPYLTLPSNEKIPMINEIKFYHKLTTTYTAGPVIKRTYQYEGKITFEIWWPFVDRPFSDTDFTFDYTINCTAPIQATPAGSILPTDFVPQIWSGLPVTLANSALNFRSMGPFIMIETTIPVSVTPVLDDKKIDSLQLDFTIKAQVKSVTDGVFVDEINNYTTSFRLLPIDGINGSVEDVRDLECLDPRYNWDIGIDKYWRYVVQSFVNPAASTLLTLSDYSAGRSFSIGDPVAVIGNPLPNTVPPLIPGKIYWINSKVGGNITIKNEAGTIISFTDPGFGKNYIKAVLDQYYLDGSNKKLKTARAYPKNTTKVRVSGVIPAQDLEYTITSYDPKTRVFNTDLAFTPSGIAYIRDVSDNSVDSLNSVNYWTLSYLDGQTHDGDPYMCVENAQLKSVAELGRLIYSYHPTDPTKIEPWTNLTFYGHNTNQLLDVFAVGDVATVDFVTTTKHGLLNPNASNIDCLATVLSGACVDDFNDTTIMNSCTMSAANEFELKDVPLDVPPHPLDRYYFTGMPIIFAGASPPLDTKKVYYVIYKDHNKFNVARSYEDAKNNIILPVSASAALFLVSPAKLTMDMARKMAPKMAGGSSINYSQLARTLSDFNFGTADDSFPYPATELEKESLLRHNIGLLSLRQNMFTIIIEVQAASGGNIPRNAAKQRAVVIVWRDPYTGEVFKSQIIWLGD